MAQILDATIAKLMAFNNGKANCFHQVAHETDNHPSSIVTAEFYCGHLETRTWRTREHGLHNVSFACRPQWGPVGFMSVIKRWLEV